MLFFCFFTENVEGLQWKPTDVYLGAFYELLIENGYRFHKFLFSARQTGLPQVSQYQLYQLYSKLFNLVWYHWIQCFLLNAIVSMNSTYIIKTFTTFFFLIIGLPQDRQRLFIIAARPYVPLLGTLLFVTLFLLLSVINRIFGLIEQPN